ncbi:HAMP domain-containing sensor histidine kinase [Streptomyces avicenniae]|uniref:HAMP domain-containing sensor histidine kinase n=1 Tax=Streptomyces avicenniae TaxID=500153 RepID=UPI000B23DF8C|nr:HAMP domain-containing sensor histidine kinase [Streptomyces avicenniae]
MRELPLRSRLALLTALAVALAVAVCATAAWFLVRDQLRSSLDDTLHDNRANPADIIRRVSAGDCWTRVGQVPENQRLPSFGNILQVTFANGDSCILDGQATVDVSDADIAVANRERVEALHDATGSDGRTYRVLTYSLDTPNTSGRGAAATVARPLSEVDDPLRSLVLVLALVAAAGAVGAAGIGVVLARAGLRPVNRLTGVVEHIARTEDLNVRIPADGDDEIARLSRSFNSMTAALAASRDLQQQLIADAGHELRTPLTSLRTNIELLVRSEETGRPIPETDRRQLLASVTAQLGELGVLIGDLQELSRPERAIGTARLDVIPLHDVARRAVSRARLRAHGMTLTAQLDPWFVRAEPSALERAVVNLLDNAVKFGAVSEGERAVRVTLHDGVLRIRDHGPGIPADELPHVFERFWRAPGARGLPGSGLGLSIVARAVRESGGDITLRPAEGGGTEAVLTLPGAAVPPPGTPAGPPALPQA